MAETRQSLKCSLVASIGMSQENRASPNFSAYELKSTYGLAFPLTLACSGVFNHDRR
jgi:hypothetical protein